MSDAAIELSHLRKMLAELSAENASLRAERDSLRDRVAQLERMAEDDNNQPSQPNSEAPREDFGENR